MNTCLEQKNFVSHNMSDLINALHKQGNRNIPKLSVLMWSVSVKSNRINKLRVNVSQPAEKKPNYTLHNKSSNLLCFAPFCAHLCAISNNFNCNDENRILGKRNHEFTDAILSIGIWGEQELMNKTGSDKIAIVSNISNISLIPIPLQLRKKMQKWSSFVCFVDVKNSFDRV